MNAMIDPSLIKKYLAGDASDAEVQQCEVFLSDPENCGEMFDQWDLEPLSGDSLIETLRNLGNQTTSVDADKSPSKSLVEQLSSLTPSQTVDQDTLDRILSPPESDDEMGRIGRYRVIEFIASGGMGLVFKAEDVGLQRLVCLKVLHPMLANHADSKARFAREAKAAAQLRNTRIVTVLDVGEHKELPFLVMELLNGQSLREKLNAEGKLPPDTAKKLTIQIAEGLRYAHGLGYLHRDIKPENVWVTTEGDIKLLDFGLARAIDETTNLTNTGTILGTPSYMSPEQVQGKELDARCDLFSVGSVMFEMLTGVTPFGKTNLFSTMMSVANDSLDFSNPSAPDSVPAQLVPVIQSLLKKSPVERTESAEALIAGLLNTEQPYAPVKTKAADSGFHRRWADLLYGLAGAACVALAFLLYQVNDKGTLVVEADPSVNVNIENEQIAILDPKTGKKFQVKIGDHPLPSGVYQLEMSDESGHYTLSSDVIAIRRGEKRIVRVELKPPLGEPSTGASATTEKNESSNAPVKALAELPTLDANQLRRKLNIQPNQPLFHEAIVTNPPPRIGTTAWSFEPAFASSGAPQINANGTLIATAGDNVIRISDRNSKFIQLIPAQDEIKQIVWSPDPNFIAVIENGKIRKQLSIWKLFDDHVEAIDVIPTDSLKVAWSWDGLFLALENENEISFVDVSKGNIFASPTFGIGGELLEHPWSYDRRYFAASVGESVKIWDLKEEKLFHIFPMGAQARFLPTGHQIAFINAGNWEVWELDSFERKQLIEPDPNWSAYFPNLQFQQIAAVTSERKLIVRDTRTGVQTESKLSFASYPYLDEKENQEVLQYAKFQWARDGRNFVGNAGDSKLVSAVRDAAGTSDVNLAEYKPLSLDYVRHVPFGSGRNARLLDLSDSNRIVYDTDFYDEQPSAVSVFDLSTLENFPQSDVSFSDSDAMFRISPDGKSVAIVGSKISLRNNEELPAEEQKERSQKRASDLSKIHVCSVDTGKLTKTLDVGAQVQELLWSPDSTTLIVSWIESKSQPRHPGWHNEQVRPFVMGKLKDYDADKDGKFSQDEMKSMSNLEFVKLIEENADQDRDGLFSVEEIINVFGPTTGSNIRTTASGKRIVPPTTDRFDQLAINVFILSTGQEIRLEPGIKNDETNQFEYCFQRSQSKRFNSGRGIAKPILYNGAIVVPMFNPVSFLTGERSQSSVPNLYQDKLGLFDPKSGTLIDVIDLQQRFEGNGLAMTDDMIMISCPSRNGSPRADAFCIIDRQNDNKSFMLGESANGRSYDNPFFGRPNLSPRHPYIAAKTRGGQLEIWKLSSKAESLSLIERLPGLNQDHHVQPDIVWHQTVPTVAWIKDEIVNCYNVEHERLTTYDSTSNLLEIVAKPDGWLLIGQRQMVEFDLNTDVKQTYLTTNPVGQDELNDPFARPRFVGVFDQCITAEGKLLSEDNQTNLRAIQLRENRIETLSIDEFERRRK